MRLVKILCDAEQQVDILKEFADELKAEVGAEEVGFEDVLFLGDGGVDFLVDERHVDFLSGLLAVAHDRILHGAREDPFHVGVFGGIG